MTELTYEEFLARKQVCHVDAGFDVSVKDLNPALFPFQREIVQWVLRKGRAAVFADCGMGKGQPYGSPVLTPSGWKPIETLTTEDYVIASDGNSYPVTGVYPKGELSTYRIFFSDGVSFVVDRDHLHITRTNNDRQRGKNWRVISTCDLLKTPLRYGASGKSRNFDIPVVKPVNFCDDSLLPIDPYVMGVLLGDGCIVYCSSFSSSDQEIIDKVQSRLGNEFFVTKKPCEGYDYTITHRDRNKNPLTRALKQIGLFGKKSADKFIPNEFLHSTIENRLELLRGLMDTDGYIKDTCQFYSVSRELADGVMFLVRSLGGIPTLKCKYPNFVHKGEAKEGQPCWIVTFSLKTFNPFSLQRKAALWNPNPRDNGRWIDRIEYAGKQKTVCISVDSPDHSYVTEHFIVTHNTICELEWGRQVCQHTGGNVLLLCPLAVAAQTRREGEKFGIPVTVCRSQADVRPGVNVTNYEMLSHFDADSFVGVACDESSILKSYMGKTKQELLSAFEATPYRTAWTATPAPNDHLELGNHAEFLGVMPSNEMIMRWFLNDTMEAGGYRLKGHAETDFWRWVCSWAVCLSSPADLGYSDEGYVLPALCHIPHTVEVDLTTNAGGALFRYGSLNATQMHREMRLTADARAATIAEIVNATEDFFLIWCNTDYEADALKSVLPDATELRGSETVATKERKLLDFAEQRTRVLITKPKLAGFGLNFQHCHQVAFMGLSYSYEMYYQALRRCWRFGQRSPVQCHVVMAESELDILKTIQRKANDHERMKTQMVAAMKEVRMQEQGRREIRTEIETNVATGNDYTLYLGDSCQQIKEMEEDSIDFSVYSPPFANLYIYSDSIADMGNCSDEEEFFDHYKFLLRDMLRVTKPGRLTAVHCKDLPMYKGRDGAAGLKDFPGAIITAHEEAGWTYHSRVTIWKDPVIEMQRTKNHGLLYKNLRENSCVSRQGMADYLLIFRKWTPDMGSLTTNPVSHTKDEFPLDLWQRYASPVWFDINQTNVLNHQIAKTDGDEKHICIARGSQVLTKERGYVPIEQVFVGENVLTHKGRWRPVLVKQNTGVRKAITVHAQGVPGLTLTPDHKLWTRISDWVRERDGAERAEPQWIEAQNTIGGYVNLQLPAIENPADALTNLHWWIVGRWLADGHWDSRGYAHISCGEHEKDNLITTLGEYAGAVHDTGTAPQIRILDRSGILRSTLHECGHGAQGKHLPAQAFSLPAESAGSLLAGYLSGDGHFREDRRRWMASSVSRVLLLGIAMLAQRVHGAIASVYAGRPAREADIEGRTVQCKQDWILSFDIPDGRRSSPFLLEDGAWKKIRSIEDAGEVETWNLRVEEDESFTAEGCIVKNCPLQLDVIERSLFLWSNPGDLVFSPFTGIGSEGYVSLKMGRRFVGCELKPGYWHIAIRNLESAVVQSTQQVMFPDDEFAVA